MTTPPTLAELLAPAALRRRTDAGSFQRGEDYAGAGRVSGLTVGSGEVRARVQGGETYRVRLGVGATGGELDHSCSCPMGADGIFCKHCVAVALVATGPAGAEGIRSGDDDVEAIRRYLEGLDCGELVDMVIEGALDDDRLFDRLRLRARLALPTADPAPAFRRAFDTAGGEADFVPWRASFDYAHRFQEVVDRLRELVEHGSPAEADVAIPIAEYGISVIEDSLERTDDSSGALSSVLDDLVELHLEVCAAGGLDPVELARRLFDWELGGEWGTFSGAAERYAAVLGEEGRAEYRRLAERLWRDVPPLGPGEDDEDVRLHHRRWRLSSILEDLLDPDPDPRERISILERDLSSPRAFLRIAGLWREAGEPERALEWAERGLESFPARYHTRDLTGFVADEYHRRGRHDEAVDLVWREYRRRPCVETYSALRAHADRAGVWADRRSEALELLRAQTGRDASTLVQVLLLEDDHEAAQREARERGCSPGLWRAIAERREAEHPEDAIAAYRRVVENELDRKSKEGYREAVALIERIRGLMERTDPSGGRPAAFVDYLETVIAAHRRKRNFMKLLEEAGLTGDGIP